MLLHCGCQSKRTVRNQSPATSHPLSQQHGSGQNRPVADQDRRPFFPSLSADCILQHGNSPSLDEWPWKQFHRLLISQGSKVCKKAWRALHTCNPSTQESKDQEFKASVDYPARPCSPTQNKNKTHIKKNIGHAMVSSVRWLDIKCAWLTQQLWPHNCPSDGRPPRSPQQCMAAEPSNGFPGVGDSFLVLFLL